jgi:carboxymethylenebutenolidase
MSNEMLNTVPVYRAEPAGEPIGVIVLIHEIWGLVEHICTVADRYAASGFLVIAPDLLSGVGVTPTIGVKLMAMMNEPDEQKRLDGQTFLRESLAPVRAPEFADVALGMLTKVLDGLEAEGHSRVGVLGFCFGGTYTYALAAQDARVVAAVPFYGTAPTDEKIAAIACPIEAFYGEIDPPIMDDFPRVEAAMREHGIDFEATVYPGVQHAFFNDTNLARFDRAARDDAWARSVRFLKDHLAG